MSELSAPVSAPAGDPASVPAAAPAELASPRLAWAFGLSTVTDDGAVLDTWYPRPALGAAPAQSGPYDVPADLSALQQRDPHRRVRQSVARAAIDLDADPADVPDAYLRLHLLSYRLVRPNEINLNGLFAVLPNVVWTNHGPCSADDFESTRLRIRAGHGPGTQLEVYGVDKFPRMTDYVLPSGVRIANADRVRLGAHLAAGTTVMHEGFVNFNAGTLGHSMVEGRISQGVLVGEGSDIGGGASIMGTLSGGGKQVISIGERCLLGANAGLGISLGDDCVVEAGLYLTAGTKLLLWAGLEPGDEPRTVKAVSLSGADGLLFRRNSLTGAVEAVARAGQRFALNAALHANA